MVFTNSNHSANVLLTFDFNAETLWLSSGENTPVPVSQGSYGANVGVPRILDLLKRYSLRATFFVSGESARRYPEQVTSIYKEGHEIAYHGEVRENPVSLFKAEEHAALKRGVETLSLLIGKRPIGFRCAARDFSSNTMDLLAEEGFAWDSSLMGDDFYTYPLEFNGKVSDLIELPVSYELDDSAYFHFNQLPYSAGLADTEKVLSIWKAEFLGAYRHSGNFNLTLHPQIMGRWHRLLMLEALIQFVVSKPNVACLTCSEVVALQSI